jgi:hypothetical protein
MEPSDIDEVGHAMANFLERNPEEGLNKLQEILGELNMPSRHNPVAYVYWVPIEKVEANDYNPNSVAKNELRLLAVSILHDGYTQPVVTVWDQSKGKYVIVDGFHRYFCMKSNDEIRERNHGLLPIVVLSKDIEDRMASTVRHNRARGKHSVAGMGVLVAELKGKGWDDSMICNELGLEADELLHLTHISGIAKMFEDKKFSPSWEEKYQIRIRQEKERQK